MECYEKLEICRHYLLSSANFQHFGLGVGKLFFERFEFGGIVQLFFRPRDLLLEILNPFLQGVDLLLRFFVHDNVLVANKKTVALIHGFIVIDNHRR